MRVLRVLARLPVPIVDPDGLAAERPPTASSLTTSPLIALAPPRPLASERLLDGDVVIKDQIDVAGMATSVGLATTGPIADRDATLVARIVAAGGRILGKAKMTELGIDGIGSVMHGGMPDNPRAPGYSPGGSSTGTAVAVASGLARYGVGGDGLGSIRIPAAFCGLVGLKPSRERLPREGVRAPVRTLDAVGPIARDAADCARLWQVMANEPIRELIARVPERVAVIRNRWMAPASTVDLAFERMLDALAVARVAVELPGFASVTFLGGMIGAHELATGPFAGRATTRAGRTSGMLGRAISRADADALYRRRDHLRAAVARVFERAPLIAMPTTSIPPPAMTARLQRGDAGLRMLRALGAYTPLANLTDLPAIAVPCGVDRQARPLSIMFIAPRGDEHGLLEVARAVEQTGLTRVPI